MTCHNRGRQRHAAQHVKPAAHENKQVRVQITSSRGHVPCIVQPYTSHFALSPHIRLIITIRTSILIRAIARHSQYGQNLVEAKGMSKNRRKGIENTYRGSDRARVDSKEEGRDGNASERQSKEERVSPTKIFGAIDRLC